MPRRRDAAEEPPGDPGTAVIVTDSANKARLAYGRPGGRSRGHSSESNRRVSCPLELTP